MERWYRWGCAILKEFVEFSATEKALVTRTVTIEKAVVTPTITNTYEYRWTCILYGDHNFSLRRFWEQVFEKQPWSVKGQKLFRVAALYIPEFPSEYKPLYGCPEFETPDDLLGFLYGITRYDARRGLPVARLLSMIRGHREPETFGWSKHQGGTYAARGLT